MDNINHQKNDKIKGIFLESEPKGITLEYVLPDDKTVYKFFCLFKIDEYNSEYRQALKFLSETAKTHYTSKLFNENEEQEKHFESTVKEINNILSATANDINPDYEIIINDKTDHLKRVIIPKDKFSGIIGTIINNNLYIADCGNIKLFLFKQRIHIAHTKKISEKIAEYNLIDILKQISITAAKTITAQRIFSKIISGPVEDNDVLCVANINNTHYIENLKKYFISSNIDTIKHNIQKQLKGGDWLLLIKIMPAVSEEKTEKTKIQTNKLSKEQQKILLLVFMIMVLTMIIGSMFYAKPKNDISYHKNLTTILTSHKIVEQKLILRENDDAHKTLKETALLIYQLPQDTQSQKEEFNKLLEKNNNLLKQVKNITEIKEPKIISSTNQNLYGLSILKSDLFAHNYNTVYKLNKNSLEEYVNINATNTRPVSGISDDGIMLFTDLLGDIKELNLYTKKIKNVDLISKTRLNPTDLVWYNKRIYALSTTENTISKYQLTGTKLVSTTYIKDKTDIKTAQAMAIDSNIYVLLSNGEILKFFQGKRIEFVIKNLDDALLAPTKIKTHISYKNLYILDPASKRIVVLDKNGVLKTQYYSEKFNDLKDIAIDEANKKIYILDLNKIYYIDLVL